MCERGDLIPSSKKIGKFELALLKVLIPRFKAMGFQVYPHVQLNISWGNIISDVDLVVRSTDKLLGIEVKSSRDSLKNVLKQLDRMLDFFDGIYVATDRPKEGIEKRLPDQRIGLLTISNGIVAERTCGFLYDKPRESSMMRLRKICLSRLSVTLNGKNSPSKIRLVSQIHENMDGENLRFVLKSIVTCERKCDTDCPIWTLEKQLLSPLRKVQSLLNRFDLTGSKPIPLIPADFDEESRNSELKRRRNPLDKERA